MQRLLISLCLVFCLFAQVLAQSSAASQEKFLRGVNAYARGDYTEAANLWLIESYEGSADAQFNLGVLYIEGKGVAQNRNEAFLWFTRAAEAGHVEAQYNLGHLHFEDKDNAESANTAIFWWRKAAEQGLAIAQYNYGRALFYGVGAPKDIEQAKFWMQQSASGGEEVATVFLQKHADALSGEIPQPIDQNIDQTSQIVESDESESDTDLDTAPGTATVTATTKAKSINVEITETQSGDSDGVVSSEQAGQPLSEQEATFVAQSDETVVKVNDNVYYVLVNKDDELVYSRFNSRAPVVSIMKARTLLRVIAQTEGWLQVQKAGGFSAWVAASDVTITKNFAKVKKDNTVLLADPTDQSSSNQIGELGQNEQLLILLKADDWIQVQSPEQFVGWVKDLSVSAISASEAEIATMWQAQRLDTRVSALTPPENTAAVAAVGEQQQQSEQEAVVAEAEESPQLEELTVDQFVVQYKDEFKVLPSEISTPSP